jgi:hypothetical protein
MQTQRNGPGSWLLLQPQINHRTQKGGVREHHLRAWRVWLLRRDPRDLTTPVTQLRSVLGGGTLRARRCKTQDLHFNTILVHKLQSLFMHIHQIRAQRLALPRRRINRRLMRHYPQSTSQSNNSGVGGTFRKLPCFLNGYFSVFHRHLEIPCGFSFWFLGGVGEGGILELYDRRVENWCGVRQLRHGGGKPLGFNFSTERFVICNNMAIAAERTWWRILRNSSHFLKLWLLRIRVV